MSGKIAVSAAPHSTFCKVLVWTAVQRQKANEVLNLWKNIIMCNDCNWPTSKFGFSSTTFGMGALSWSRPVLRLRRDSSEGSSDSQDPETEFWRGSCIPVAGGRGRWRCRNLISLPEAGVTPDDTELSRVVIIIITRVQSTLAFRTMSGPLVPD